jgi:hypothetical protein
VSKGAGHPRSLSKSLSLAIRGRPPESVRTTHPNYPPTNVLLVFKMKFFTKICLVLKEIAKAASFGTKRSIAHVDRRNNRREMVSEQRNVVRSYPGFPDAWGVE